MSRLLVLELVEELDESVVGEGEAEDDDAFDVDREVADDVDDATAPPGLENIDGRVV